MGSRGDRDRRRSRAVPRFGLLARPRAALTLRPPGLPGESSRVRCLTPARRVSLQTTRQSTYALWGVILSALVMRKTEAVTPPVALAAALIVAGAAAVAATR